MEALILEADVNSIPAIDVDKFLLLHSRYPLYAEQITFMLMNTDNDTNNLLTRGELIEASRMSPDLNTLNFNNNQLVNILNGLLTTGDVDADGKICFEEYAACAPHQESMSDKNKNGAAAARQGWQGL